MKPLLAEVKEKHGKFSDQVALHCWIPLAQDTSVRLFCQRTGYTKTQAITEAIQYWLNAQKGMGVL